MADAKHTGGPWEYVQASESHGAYVVTQYGQTICDLYVMTGSGPIAFTPSEATANARLIAAAPDLLEALRECMEGEFATTDKVAIAKARAAIAKAEGRS